jgi:hypothetical protein
MVARGLRPWLFLRPYEERGVSFGTSLLVRLFVISVCMYVWLE